MKKKALSIFFILLLLLLLLIVAVVVIIIFNNKNEDVFFNLEMIESNDGFNIHVNDRRKYSHGPLTYNIPIFTDKKINECENVTLKCGEKSGVITYAKFTKNEDNIIATVHMPEKYVCTEDMTLHFKLNTTSECPPPKEEEPYKERDSSEDSSWEYPSTDWSSDTYNWTPSDNTKTESESSEFDGFDDFGVDAPISRDMGF